MHPAHTTIDVKEETTQVDDLEGKSEQVTKRKYKYTLISLTLLVECVAIMIIYFIFNQHRLK